MDTDEMKTSGTMNELRKIKAELSARYNS